MKTFLGLTMIFCVCVAAPGQQTGFTAKSESAKPPLASLTVGELTYEQVSLVSFQNGAVKFSHSLGVKSVPLVALTAEQVTALNGTAEKVSIQPGSADLTAP